MLALNTQSRQQANDALGIGVDVIMLCQPINQQKNCVRNHRG
jgi:hypothetical protein